MPGPLSELKILDFTNLLPGPTATLYLADLGAEVLRIFWAGRPDLVEVMPPFISDTKVSAASAYLNRGKSRLNLNLKAAAATEIVKRLLATYDILVEGYRPGVMNSLGLGYEELRHINPRLIYCSLTGFGQNGPWAQKPSHDINYLALSGIMSYSGDRKTGPPLLGVQMADLGGSLNAVIGILAAVITRKNSGLGQYVDVAIFDGILAINGLAIAGFLADGREPAPESQMLNGGTLYDYYRTSDGYYISVGALEPKFLQAFYRALDYLKLTDQTIYESVCADDLLQIKKEIQRIISGQPLSYWVEIFQRVEACVEPVLTLRQALELDQVVARKMVVDVKGPGDIQLRQLGFPIKFSDTIISPGSVTDFDDAKERQRSLLEKLGFQEEEIYQLIQDGVLVR